MDNEFIGEAGNALYEYLINCRKKFAEPQHEYYAKFASVCNSSGTGKTKAILQVPSFCLHHKVWRSLTVSLQLRNYKTALLYINMREATDDRNFPLRDTPIADLFESAMSSASDYSYSCTLIFRALFQQLLIEFKQRLPTHTDFITMAETWNEDFTPLAPDTQKRDLFFGAVRKLYDNVCALFTV
jgi:hypothetical protein